MNWKRILIICLSLLILPSAVFAQNGLSGGITAYYDFDELAGTTLNNLVSASFDGSNSGATIGESGIIDTSYDFDGTNDEISLGSSALISGNQWTISTWVYPDSFSTRAGIFNRGRSGGNGILLATETDGTLEAYWYGTSDHGLATTTALSTGAWSHIVWVHNGASEEIYINGVLDETATTNSQDVTTSVGYDVAIGRFAYTGSRFWDGKIDETGIWNSALTSDQVTDLYNSGSALAYSSFDSAPPPGSIVEYYNLSESSSPYVSSVSSADMTATNAPTQATGIIGYGQDFDGSNDCIGETIADLSNLADEITINLWVKTGDPDPTDQYATFVARNTWSAGAFGMRSAESAHAGRINWEQNSLSGNSLQTSAETYLTDDNWHMITGIINKGVRQVWVDGALENSNTYSNSNPTMSAITSLGCRNKADRFFAGIIDEVAFFDVGLQSEHIVWLYNSGAPGSDQQYPFAVTPPNNPPTITNITNQVVLEDSVTTFENLFTINDSDGDISDLVVTYVSSNTTLIANTTGITFAVNNVTGQANATITPEANQYGITTITVTVTDLSAGAGATSFTITVTNVNDGPTISTINNVTTLSGATVIVPFTVLDIDNPYTDLTYSASSDNAPLFTSSTFSETDGTNQNLTLILATFGQALVNVTVSDLEPLSDSTTFNVYSYCNNSSAPYTDTNFVDAPPFCYNVTGSFDEDTDIFTYTWFDFGNSTENNFIEIYRTTAGSNELVAELASTNNSGSFEVNLSAYPKDDFRILGHMTDTSRTFMDGDSTQRVYILNVNQQLNLAEAWFTDGNPSDGVIWSLLIVLLFLTIGIASQSATMTLILSIFGLFFATNMVYYVPSQFLWATGVVVAILIGIIAKLRID